MSESKPSSQPVILAFQPMEFRPCETPEELQEWESMMKGQLGLDPSTDAGGQTVSLTGQERNYDDSDYNPGQS